MKSIYDLRRLSDIEEYKFFNARAFFEKKKLRLVSIESDHPLTIIAEIVEDETRYPKSDDGKPYSNKGKYVLISLNKGYRTELGQLLKNFIQKGEELAVAVEYESSDTECKYGRVKILTPRMVFVDKQNNVEQYIIPDSDYKANEEEKNFKKKFLEQELKKQSNIEETRKNEEIQKQSNIEETHQNNGKQMTNGGAKHGR